MEDFMNSVPPEADQEGWGLISMVGVEDIPDNGYKIGEIFYEDNDAFAEVEVTLKYSEGDIVKIFYLSKTDDLWQVDYVGN